MFINLISKKFAKSLNLIKQNFTSFRQKIKSYGQKKNSALFETLCKKLSEKKASENLFLKIARNKKF